MKRSSILTDSTTRVRFDGVLSAGVRVSGRVLSIHTAVRLCYFILHATRSLYTSALATKLTQLRNCQASLVLLRSIEFDEERAAAENEKDLRVSSSPCAKMPSPSVSASYMHWTADSSTVR